MASMTHFLQYAFGVRFLKQTLKYLLAITYGGKP
jgi:hypothetical protein